MCDRSITLFSVSENCHILEKLTSQLSRAVVIITNVNAEYLSLVLVQLAMSKGDKEGFIVKFVESRAQNRTEYAVKAYEVKSNSSID